MTQHQNVLNFSPPQIEYSVLEPELLSWQLVLGPYVYGNGRRARVGHHFDRGGMDLYVTTLQVRVPGALRAEDHCALDEDHVRLYTKKKAPPSQQRVLERAADYVTPWTSVAFGHFM
jgi:hypothetical protein